LREPAVYELGAPIEFHVDVLRVDGSVAFVRAEAKRPGGKAIDLSKAPISVRPGSFGEVTHSSVMEAFLKLEGGVWRVDKYAVGTTAFEWIGPSLCPDYKTLITNEMCN